MTKPVSNQQREESRRFWANTLGHWYVCDNKACGRARACRGNARLCLLRNFELLPEGVRDWFIGLATAQQQQLPFDDTLEKLEAIGAGPAFRAWWETVEALRREQTR